MSARGKAGHNDCSNPPLSGHADIDLRQRVLRNLELGSVVDPRDQAVLTLVEVVERVPGGESKLAPLCRGTARAELVKDMVAGQKRVSTLPSPGNGSSALTSARWWAERPNENAPRGTS